MPSLTRSLALGKYRLCSASLAHLLCLLCCSHSLIRFGNSREQCLVILQQDCGAEEASSTSDDDQPNLALLHSLLGQRLCQACDAGRCHSLHDKLREHQPPLVVLRMVPLHLRKQI